MTQPETAAGTEAGDGGRGRPRPQSTIDRDERALQVLVAAAEPLTRNELAEKLGVSPAFAYLSLSRLRRDGYVKRADRAIKANAWTAIEQP